MRVLVIGGGICGLGAALLLARDGHEVTVLERDADPVPASSDAAWDQWHRKGVAQFRQPHNFMPGLRLLLEAELPEIQEALERAGAARFDLVNPLPPFFTDRAPRPIDEKLWTLTARRPVGEWVFANAAQNARGLSIRRGVGVDTLLIGASAIDGVPHVAGVCTSNGDELRADLVVDATGRQSRSPQWLMAIGARPPYEEQEDCGFTYYTRYFRGVQPQRVGGALTPLGSISLLTLPGDRDTWSVTIFVATGDQPLKNLRHEAQWMKAIRACPLQAHWLEGEPISPVLAMSGIADRYRRFVVDGRPVATGLVAVADALACTDPSAGRGLTVGFLHALRLRDALRAHGEIHARWPKSSIGGQKLKSRHGTRRRSRWTAHGLAKWWRCAKAVSRRRPPMTSRDALAADGLDRCESRPVPRRARYIGTVTPLQEILERPAVIQRLAAAREALKEFRARRYPDRRGVSCSRSRAEEAAGTTTRRPVVGWFWLRED